MIEPLLVLASLLTFASALPGPGAAPTEVALAPFRAVELSGGGTLTLRHGPTRRATLLQGSLEHTRVAVADGWLVVESRAGDCPPGYRLEIEVVTPEIAAVAVANGGTLRSRGPFPPQPSIAAGVEQGGTIDIRSLAATQVEASVYSGGVILVHPRESLLASVTQGGRITYWGAPRVQSSTRHGGAVVQGTAAEAEKPLSELSPGLPPLPPVPPVPPVPPAN